MNKTVTIYRSCPAVKFMWCVLVERAREWTRAGGESSARGASCPAIPELCRRAARTDIHTADGHQPPQEQAQTVSVL